MLRVEELEVRVEQLEEAVTRLDQQTRARLLRLEDLEERVGELEGLAAADLIMSQLPVPSTNEKPDPQAS